MKNLLREQKRTNKLYVNKKCRNNNIKFQKYCTFALENVKYIHKTNEFVLCCAQIYMRFIIQHRKEENYEKRCI